MIELAVLFLLVLFVSLAVYHVANLTTKETSFEEVLANQKIQNLNIIPMKNEHVHKKKAKRIKTKKEDVSRPSVGKFHKLSAIVVPESVAKYTDEKRQVTNRFEISYERLSQRSTKNEEFGLKINSMPDILETQLETACNNQTIENLDMNDKRIKECENPIEKNNQSNFKKKAKELASSNEVQEVISKTNFQGPNVKEDAQKDEKKVKNVNNSKLKKGKSISDEKQSENEITISNDSYKKSENSQNIGKKKTGDVGIEINNVLSDEQHMKRNVKMRIEHAHVVDLQSNTFDKSRDNFKSALKEVSLIIKNKSLPCIDNTYHATNTTPSPEIISPTCKEETKVVKNLSSLELHAQNTMEIEMKPIRRKSKDEKKKKRAFDDSSSRLLTEIQKCQLNGFEIQMLIEALLNKELTKVSGGEWVEKGKIINPVSQLKRQLEESETKVQEQSETTRALSAKISELRSELNSEKSRNLNLKKQFDNSSALLQQKLDSAAALHREQLLAGLNETKIALNKEYHAKLVQQQQSASRENEIQMQNYQTTILELEKQLQQFNASHQESEIRYHQVKNTLSDAQHQLKDFNLEREELVQTCHKYQQHMASLKDQNTQQEAEFKSRLFEVQQNFSTSEASSKQILSQLHQSSIDKELLDQKIRSLENVRELLSQNQVKLKQTVNDRMDLENRLIAAENESCNLRELVKSQKLEIERLKKEKESLAAMSFRPAVEGQENGSQHEHFANHHFNSTLSSISTYTKQISKLKEDLVTFNADNKDDEKIQKQRRTQRIVPFEENTKVVEKIIEKIVQDPLTLKQLKEIKEKNDYLEEQVKKLAGEKLLNESNPKSNVLEDQSRLIQDLQLENKSLTEKISNYQCILANTESLLKTLQKSVENEEATWQEKMLEKEEVLRQLLVDKKSLNLRVSELNSSLKKIKEAEEMETELNNIKEKLACEVEAKHQLEQQLVLTKKMLQEFNSTQVRTNGHHQIEILSEDGISQADSTSLYSSQDFVTHKNADISVKKKKKNFFSKFIRKANNTESERQPSREEE